MYIGWFLYGILFAVAAFLSVYAFQSGIAAFVNAFPEWLVHGHKKKLPINYLFVLVGNYIPESIFPGLDQYDLAENSLYDIFAREYRVKVMRAKRAIRTRIAEPEFAKFFGVECGSPVLYITNIAVDQNDRLVDFSKEYLDGVTQKFEFDVINKWLKMKSLQNLDK